MLRWIRRTVELAAEGAAGLAKITVLIIVVAFGYEVVARYLFNNPTGFVNQLGAYAVPVIAFLSAAWILSLDEHVRIDLFINKLPRRHRDRWEVFLELLSLVIILVVLYYAIRFVDRTASEGTRTFTTVFSYPEWVAQLVLPIGFSILSGMQIIKLYDAVKRLRNRGDNVDGESSYAGDPRKVDG